MRWHVPESSVLEKVRISFGTPWPPRCYGRARLWLKSANSCGIATLKLPPSTPRWISPPYEHWHFPGREVPDEHTTRSSARLPRDATCSGIQVAGRRYWFTGFRFLLGA